MTKHLEELREERLEWLRKAQEIAQRASDEGRALNGAEPYMVDSFMRKYNKIDAEIRTRSDPNVRLMEIEGRRYLRETWTPAEELLEEQRMRGVLLDREIEEHNKRMTGS